MSQPARGAPPYRPNGAISQAQFHYLWPMFTLNVVPGPRNMAVLAFVPLDVDHTLTITDYFYGDEADEQARRDLRAFGDQVGQEDKELVESIQRAARSGGLEEGRLLLSSEHLIQHFQRLVEQALTSD